MRHHITDRDITLLKFLNEFGFSGTKLIQRAIFNKQSERGAYVTARNRISSLSKLGLIEIHQNIFCKEQVLSLSEFGANFIQKLGGNKMAIVKNLRDREVVHDFQIQNIYLRFRNLGFSNFISERKIREQSLFGELYPDLVMIDKESKAIMVEVELTQKSKTRMDKILTNYANSKLTNKLLYICAREGIKKAVTRRAERLDLLQSKFLAVTLDQFHSPEFNNEIRSLMDGSDA